MAVEPSVPGDAGASGGDAQKTLQSMPQLIGVSGPGEDVALYQLAARWAETFAPAEGDTLRNMLKRYRDAYEYLDAIVHGNKPPEIE